MKSKTWVLSLPIVLMWTGEKGALNNRRRHSHGHIYFSHAQMTMLHHYRSYLLCWSFECGRAKTLCYESAGDAKISMRFRWGKKGGIQKRISVDEALVSVNQIYNGLSWKSNTQTPGSWGGSLHGLVPWFFYYFFLTSLTGFTCIWHIRISTK